MLSSTDEFASCFHNEAERRQLETLFNTMLLVHPPFLNKVDSRDTEPDHITTTYAKCLFI